MEKYFLTAFLFSLAAYPAARLVARRWGIIDRPGRRKIHREPVARTGGYQVMAGLAVSFFIYRYHFHFYSAFAFLAAIFLMGALEDKYRLRSMLRLILVIALATPFIISGYYLPHAGFFPLPAWFSIPFTIFCLVGIINAFNFTDGINGLSSFLSILALIFIALTAEMHDYITLPRFALLGAGALSGFFVPHMARRRIFLGDSGAYLAGAMVGIAALFLLRTKPAVSPWAVLLYAFVPVFDTLFTIHRRRRSGTKVLRADQLHLHHRLLERYGGDQTRTWRVLCAFQALLCAAAFFLRTNTPALIALATAATWFLRRLWQGSIRPGFKRFRLEI